MKAYSDENPKRIDEAFKKFAPKMNKLMAAKFRPKCHEVVSEAYRSHSWQGFTGQSLNAFTSYMLIGGSIQWVASSSSYAPSPVFPKVQKGAKIFLPNPVEGKPRTVYGQVDIMFPEVDQAVSAIRNIPFRNQNNLVFAMRFAYPIEYDKNVIDFKQNNPVRGLYLMWLLAGLSMNIR